MLLSNSLPTGRLQIRRQVLLLAISAWLSVFGFTPEQSSAEDQDATDSLSVAEHLNNWEFVHEATVPPDGDNPLCDFVLDPDVFDGARLDLADLRLHNSRGAELPYALRTQYAKDATEDVKNTKRFNQAGGPNNTSQLSLDLGEQRIEHNEVEVELPGANFRRHVVLAGSDDGDNWSQVTEQDLLRFDVNDKKLVHLTIGYKPIRYRYLRLTLSPDPSVDKGSVSLGKVVVRRRVRLPGELTTRSVPFAERQAVPGNGGPGSAWIVDLGGRDIPCSRLLVEIGDVEFARDWYVEAGGPAESKEPFHWIAGGTWRRRAGEPVKAMVAEFGEVQAGRLRLVVTDFKNPPLQISACKVEAAARVVVFQKAKAAEGPVSLYYGNPKAEAPNYDFARNLPPRIEPAPERGSLGNRQTNPVFQPDPLPLTERWPWLIYVLLGLAVVVLGALILSLAPAIRLHDAEPAVVAQTGR